MINCPLLERQVEEGVCSMCMWYSTKKGVCLKNERLDLVEYAAHRGVENVARESREAQNRIALALITVEYIVFLKKLGETFKESEELEEVLAKWRAAKPYVVKLGITSSLLLAGTLKKNWSDFCKTMPSASDYNLSDVLFISERQRAAISSYRRKLMKKG